MNSYPKHVGDFIRDTVGLSMLEDGAYNRMLDQYYAREAALPLDRGELYRLCRAASKGERAAVDYVLGCFFEKRDDGYHQKRADEELVRFADRADAARRSAAARWHSDDDANAMRTHSEGNAGTTCERNPSQEPIANSQEKKKQRGARAAPADPQGTRLPSDWTPPEDWHAWAMKERGWTPQQVDHVAMKFREYWTGKGGKAARKLDWPATWRNWVWGERLIGYVSGASRPTSLAERRAENWDRITGRKRDERVIDGAAVRVGGAAVPALRGDLREQGADDVGEHGPGRVAAGLG